MATKEKRRDFQIFKTLSPREMEVLRFAAMGRSIKLTAKEMDISPTTVQNHRGHILVKMGCINMVEVVHLANKTGVI